MKLAIAATPEVAITTLDALLHSDHEIAFLITKPDSKSGMGQKILPSPVAVWSHANKVGLLQPISINEIADQLREIDIVVTIGYGSLIGEEILTLPRFGFITCISLYCPDGAAQHRCNVQLRREMKKLA